MGTLRGLIREEYLHGVPEFELRQDTAEFIDAIRERITRFILVNKSETGTDRAEAIRAMNDVCDDLELKVYNVIEDGLYAFTRKI